MRLSLPHGSFTLVRTSPTTLTLRADSSAELEAFRARHAPDLAPPRPPGGADPAWELDVPAELLLAAFAAALHELPLPDPPPPAPPPHAPLTDDELRPHHVPPPDAPWRVIEAFALRLPPSALPEPSRRAALAQSRRPATLSELRSCLYEAQRAHRHWGSPPSGSDLTYVRALLVAIRAIVAVRREPTGVP